MSNYLIGIKKEFEYYKMLGEKTFSQLPDEKLSWQYNEESNSIATIVKHLWGNMLSRWTDFLITDGEKEWRNRDAEFDNGNVKKEEILTKWHTGWNCLFTSLSSLTEDDLKKRVYIRNHEHTVTDAILRQLAHYSYHVGQIVFIGKMICNETWTSLTVPKGKSQEFNVEKFSRPKHTECSTDDSPDKTK